MPARVFLACPYLLRRGPLAGIHFQQPLYTVLGCVADLGPGVALEVDLTLEHLQMCKKSMIINYAASTCALTCSTSIDLHACHNCNMGPSCKTAALLLRSKQMTTYRQEGCAQRQVHFFDCVTQRQKQ